MKKVYAAMMVVAVLLASVLAGAPAGFADEANLLTNADWEQRDPYVITPLYYNRDGSAQVEYGAFGIDGSNGLRVTLEPGEWFRLTWPDPLDAVFVDRQGGALYNAGISFRSKSRPYIGYPYSLPPGFFGMGVNPMEHEGFYDWDPIMRGYYRMTREADGWWRVTFQQTGIASVDPVRRWVGWFVMMRNQSAQTVTIQLDNPSLGIGLVLPARWRPGAFGKRTEAEGESTQP